MTFKELSFQKFMYVVVDENNGRLIGSLTSKLEL